MVGGAGRAQPALTRSRGVCLNGAHFPRARARRSRATRSASRPTRSSRLGGASPISFSRVLFRDFPSDVGQQTDPQSDRPAGAACWPPSPLLEFGLGAGAAAAAPDSMVWSAAPGERSEVRGRLRYHPDRNSTELWRVPPLYPLTRAHEGRADPATLVSRATRDQTDPLAPPAGRRRHFQWVPPINRSQRDHPKTERARFRLGANDELGRSRRTLMMMLLWLPAAPRGSATGSSPNTRH